MIFAFPLFCYSQTANFWTKKNDFGGLKRERAVAFSIGNYGYVATGVDTAEIVLKDLWQYDPLTDTWMQKADLPGSARRDAVGFAVGGKGYVGSGIDNDESFAGIKLKDFWQYNPVTNSWLQVADFPGAGGAGIYFATAFGIDSKGYVCGGKIGPNTYTNQLWEYKPSINQWTQRANFPGGVRYQLSSFAIDYNGYVGLGANQDIFKKDFWKYNAGTNQWTQIADLPASERGAACTFTIGQRGFVCMGTDGGILDDLWEYNPTSNQWLVRAPYGGSERKNAIAFVVNEKAYVGTGKGYSGKKSGMEEYTPYNLVGLSEISSQTFNLYPNPASNYFIIENTLQQISNCTIYTSSGHLLKEVNIGHENKIQIERDDLKPGVYIVVLKDGQGNNVQSKQLILL